MAGDQHQPLDFTELNELTDKKLVGEMLRCSNRLSLDFPMMCVGSTNDPSDIASDYLDAMYFGERIAEHCSSIDARPIYLDNGGMLLRFDMTAIELTPFIQELRRLISGFDPNGDLDPNIRDEVADLEGRLFKTKLRLPELGDSYLANFLSGTQYGENKRYWRKKHPTWRWGFWRSFAADRMRAELYTSNSWEGAWIVLGGRSTVERLLAEYGGFTAAGAKLRGAASIRLDHHPHLLVTSQTIVLVPTSKVDNAVACWRRCIAPNQARTYFNLKNPPDNKSGYPNSDELESFRADSQNRIIGHLQKHHGGCPPPALHQNTTSIGLPAVISFLTSWNDAGAASYLAEILH